MSVLNKIYNFLSQQDELADLINEVSSNSEKHNSKTLSSILSMFDSNKFYENADKNLLSNLKEIEEQSKQELDELKNIPIDRQEELFDLLHPLGKMPHNKAKDILKLKQKRKLTIKNTNDKNLTNPAKQIIFTSNILLSPPLNSDMEINLKKQGFSREFWTKVIALKKEEQNYWYDHPVPLGIETQRNEIIYGLNELNKSIQWEKDHNSLHKDTKIKCFLSVSVTHIGLTSLSKEYLLHLFKNHSNFTNIDIYIFTEHDVKQIINLIFKNKKYSKILTVNGYYANHYNFLKVMPYIYSKLCDNSILATFKIDLDQVFPQEELKKQTGYSLLEHFMTKNWGATATDYDNVKHYLGMIAGGLVNEKDFSKGLFYPDICYPLPDVKWGKRIFNSAIPQATSTKAEITCNYKNDEIANGQETILKRYHVTGGTNGILLSALKKYKPFTPSFIGRAEDQCYIISSLANKNSKRLSYLHQSGLVMRHDKEAFAYDVIKASNNGKIIGDLERILLFSKYYKTLFKDDNTIKQELQPFTGSFITRYAKSTVLLKFLLEALDIYVNNNEEFENFIQIGIKRLNHTLKFCNHELSDNLKEEQKLWNNFYDIINVNQHVNIDDILNNCIIKT